MRLFDEVAKIQLKAGGPGSGRHSSCPGGSCNKHPVEAYGQKGMKNAQWSKQFKSTDHLNDWAEKNSADVHGVRSIPHNEIPSNWTSAGFHEGPMGGGED